MNDNLKTTVFVAVAVAMLGAAWVFQPKAVVTDAQNDVGKAFFPEFSDPLASSSLEVLSYDEATGDQGSFKVQQENGAWVIPSHHNYPADGADQMSEAAAAVIGLSKLSIETDDPSQHEVFGVKNPEKVEEAETGVGTLIRMDDKDGNPLVRLIVGKEVPDRDGLRYVRVPSQDRVYTTKIDIAKLSTKFVDWVEKDFLDLTANDIKRITLDSHSIDEARGRIQPGEILQLAYDGSAEKKWQVKNIELQANEELVEDKLNDMRTAVDDLKITDVEVKPSLLVENLKNGNELFKDLNNPGNSQIVNSLKTKGFFPVLVASPQGQIPQIFSNQGQVFVGMNDGVEYVLRFGEVAQDDSAKADPPADGDAPKGNSRYIYVVARVNTDLLERPTLDPVPAVPSLEAIIKEMKAKAEPKTPDSPLPDKPKKPEGNKQPEPKAPAPAPVKPEPSEPDPRDTGDKPDQPTPKRDAQPKDGSGKGSGDEGTASNDAAKKTLDAANTRLAEVEELKAGAEKQAAEKDTAGNSDGPTQGPLTAEQQLEADAKAELKKRTQAADRVKQENERKQKAYDDKVAAAKKRVDALNGRFAKWYYIISDDVYRKIRLSRTDIVKKKEVPAAQKNAAEGKAFLAQNKTKPGVVTTASGLQYQILAPGEGESPKATSTVTVNYKGTLIDGTVFDESKATPATFRVDGVIKGWTEALQLMKPGAKYKLFIPSDLAYGNKGSGPKIGPNATLIFEVELLKVN